MRKLLMIFGQTLFTLMLCLSQEGAYAGGETVNATELERIMSPVALYPDALLFQVLIATTYPNDVIEAVNWSKNNPGKQGDTALFMLQKRYWDLSVISLLAFPQVLVMMGRQPEWVQKTGDAFLENPDAVMEVVKKLRRQAKRANKQEAIEQKRVVDSTPSTESITIIEPADSRVVYLPPNNTSIIYGTSWSPYYYRPRYYGYYYRPRFYNPDFRSWYYRPYGYGYGNRYGAW